MNGNGERPAVRDAAAATGNDHAPATRLPEPESRRWQPLRCGLVDLFYYDREEFWFRDGRLLLRGNNGTGKSKVLALTLPFLLDGEVSPHRVEPDGDAGKRMEWNLLLDGRYPERIGYVWLELGRLDQDTARYLTLGCGMKAVAGRGAPARWFFSTDRRVGADLWLVTPTGTAKTKDRLVDALGERGHVTEQPSAWRRHVDERLFDLGEERYEALLRLLIQLRQPQLSKRPNESALSAALTEALAPPDQAMLADVAEAFRSLEHDRSELAGLIEARETVGVFAGRYRRVAGIATRRRAADVRAAQSEYERTNRDRSAAEAELDARRAAEVEAAAKVARLDGDAGLMRSEQTALRDSPAMRDARILEREDEVATADERAARDAGSRSQEAGRFLAQAQRTAQEAETELIDARADLGETLDAADEAAEAAGVRGAHREALGHATPAGQREPADATLADHGEPAEDAGPTGVRPEIPSVPTPASIEPPDEGDIDRARRAADAAIDRRQVAVRRIEALVRAVDAAETALAAARNRRDDVASQRDQTADDEQAAARAVADEGERLRAALRAWAGELQELAPGDVDDLDADLVGWIETLEGQNPMERAVRSAYQRSASALAAIDAGHARDEAALAEQARVLGDEREGLERGEVAAPPAPHTRDPQARQERPGAPLWQVIDFADDLDAPDRAGLEAALESSGLLDGWVTPDGSLLDPGTHDAVVTAGNPVGSSLAAALHPVIDRDDPQAGALGEDAVAAVLAGIGLEAATADTWVAVDGRWRVGVMEGAWAKPAPRYIGHAAREDARRRRLAEISADLADLDRRRADTAHARTALAERRARLESEAAGVPGTRALIDAHGRLAALARQRAQLDGRVAALDLRVAEAAAAHGAAVTERDETASDLQLPIDREALADVEVAVGRYRQACAGLWPRLQRHRRALGQRATTRAAVERARTVSAQREEDATAATRRAEASAQRVATLRAQVGAGVEELHRRLAEVAQRLESIEAERAAAERQRADHERAVITLTERVRLLTEQAEMATDTRRAATASFQRFAATGLVAAAAGDRDLPDPHGADWAPDPTVRLARELERHLAHLDAGADAWERAQHDLSERFRVLADTLSRHGHHAELELRADAPVVTITFQQRRVTPAELYTRLDITVADREALLSARERELLEEHLVAEVAAHLADRIATADAQLARINDELVTRPTSTGMTLRLRWTPRRDAPTGLAEARRRLLRQTADAWSPEDRQAVGQFLQDQIAAVRAAREAGTWMEHLTEALDYRRWHAFTVERRRDGRWESATGPASGGERALAVTIPMLAAAASFYDTAGNPHAPRPIMLDEAFAGIDDDAREKSFGLLSEFDLDVVATSEREWGCYPTVPGLAIAQLARRDGVDAVHVARWEWDGAVRAQVQVALPPLAEPAPRAP